MKFYIKGLIFCCMLIAMSCKKDSTVPANDFDRAALAANWANNIILPSYRNFNDAVNELDNAIRTFNTTPSGNNLSTAQGKFKNAYLAWQKCSPLGFGPADQLLLSKNLNTFPTNVIKINTNIASGNYNLDQIANLDAKGFPALDFLLFGIGANNNSILPLYATDTQASKRKDYLAAVSDNIKTQSDNVLNAWLPTGGNYLATFLNAKGTDVGSALGQVINGLDYDVDVLKNYKVAIPVGIMPSSGTQTGGPLPYEVEAYYSGISSQLIQVQLSAVRDIYLGNAAGTEGVGLDDYLIKINAQRNGSSLSDVITQQFASAITSMQAIPDPFSSVISNNPSTVISAYAQLQQLLVLLKTDMPSSLGVLITYNDNDGD
ncbi:iron-regulated protein A precursor [Cytophagales bacterium WSM2-2]|nr:iron-regulated protein A precursor [Cytophagales bacterium WSM2-2]